MLHGDAILLSYLLVSAIVILRLVWGMVRRKNKDKK